MKKSQEQCKNLRSVVYCVIAARTKRDPGLTPRKLSSSPHLISQETHFDSSSTENSIQGLSPPNENVILNFSDLFDLHYCFIICSRKDLAQLFERLKSIQNFDSDFKAFQSNNLRARNLSSLQILNLKNYSRLFPNDLFFTNHFKNAFNLSNHELHTAVAASSIVHNSTGSLSVIDGWIDTQQLAWFLAVEQKEICEDYIQLAHSIIQVSCFVFYIQI